ncbi:MAG: Stp1/IreP family PP2C-type Ser/Thr phosphatase [Clostridia bacterium]|nr:Stp1/IreP family PP2C-type Ser/Thr phosphatase [Clostridia bacterium]
MEFVAKTDVGLRRSNNEDSYFAKKYSDEVSLYIVADGLGGYEGGEIASRLLTIKMSRYFEEHLNDDLKDESIVSDILLTALDKINGEIYKMEKSSPKYNGMGTTIVLVAVIYNKVYYLSVGDSRLYYISNDRNSIKQITEDDTYVNTLLKTNAIEQKDVENHPQKHVLTKAIGVFKDIKTELHVLNETSGYLLLCTDGLTNMLDNEDILQVLQMKKFENTADEYIKKANENGGVDNTTVVVIKL